MQDIVLSVFHLLLIGGLRHRWNRGTGFWHQIVMGNPTRWGNNKFDEKSPLDSALVDSDSLYGDQRPCHQHAADSPPHAAQSPI